MEDDDRRELVEQEREEGNDTQEEHSREHSGVERIEDEDNLSWRI